MSVEAITDQNFEEKTKQGVVLVDFWAPWCAPCRMIAPMLAELQDELGDKVTIVKLNVDENPEVASKYGVTSIPTLLVFKGGEMVERSIGAGPKDHYKQLLEKQF